jgi:hypothetical protein
MSQVMKTWAIRERVEQLLRNAVKAAFPVHPIPFPDLSALGDLAKDEEISEVLHAFVGVSWLDFNPKNWIDYQWSLAFLPREAFTYFLPSLITVSIANPVEVDRAVDDAITIIARSGAACKSQVWRKIEGITCSQLLVIANWIIFLDMADIIDEVVAADALAVLNSMLD